MPFYRLRRHVIYDSACGQTREVWGIDRHPACSSIKTVGAPRDTDADDPLRHGDCGCPLLLKFEDGRYVSWNNIWEWLSEAEDAGYEVISGFKKMSPYSTIIIQGP
jgi:hypothetical protein